MSSSNLPKTISIEKFKLLGETSEQVVEVEMDDLTEKSKWKKLVETISDFKERAGIVFEKKLGRSNNNNQLFGDDDDDLLQRRSNSNLLDPHETFQRSYGSVPSSPRGGPSYPTNSADLKFNNFEKLPLLSHDVDGNRFSSDSSINPSAPPLQFSKNKGHGLLVPIINIEQDDRFLTVNSANGHNAAFSSGFNSAPPSPSPSIGRGSNASMFDFETSRKFTFGRWVKIGILITMFVGIAGVITVTSENEVHFVQISSSSENPYAFPLKLLKPFTQLYPVLAVVIKGAFFPKQHANWTTNRLYVDVEQISPIDDKVVTITESWEIPIFSDKNIGFVPESTDSNTFNLDGLNWDNRSYSLVFRTNTEKNFPLSVSLKLVSQSIASGAVFGGLVIVGLYILIIFELINRTLSAMLAATAAIGILSIFDERPTTEEMVSWLDMETLILLFSMMILVSIMCETGFFDYCAYFMYKVTNGEVWPMITSLCMFTAVVSAFLDNVTTILLMTPVTIRICEAMELNPVPVLISIVVFSNMGGAVTPVGDPPNVIISNNAQVIASGIDFTTFSSHMLLGIIPVILVAYIQLRIMFRSLKSLQFSEPYDLAELRREIEVWSRAADSLSSYSKDESQVKALLLSKVVNLKNKFKLKVKMGGQSVESYKANLLELKDSCKIRDWTLLIKCGVVLSGVILLFFLHSIPQLNLSMGWTALLGAVLLLILADPKDLEGILARVEWSTLIFFSALFIVMEGVSRLGLLEWIGNQTETIIKNVNPESRLTVAMLLILWVSGLASAFIDNIPFTTMMVKIVTRVADNVGLPMQPLIWALAFGTCLGGNGTIIGASANVVCAGVADQHGYRFSFMEYFKIGFPMMIVSLIVASGYLAVCHTWFSWNS